MNSQLAHTFFQIRMFIGIGMFPIISKFDPKSEGGGRFNGNDKPERKNDYILAGSGVETIRSDIADVRASDHRPLTA
jgi:hypothetical protein